MQLTADWIHIILPAINHGGPIRDQYSISSVTEDPKVCIIQFYGISTSFSFVKLWFCFSLYFAHKVQTWELTYFLPFS
ncbi:hypothetical protein XELAEV_18032160mg [Xenopus laevis]|uniref:Uncharacterized protein n=1 Tax=Xenopus laevis TaxID=8355 RepID=A0A974HGD2_XENLA|nr:hypothetical protein XELAEV_18032160mg [Xenopus laevis]